MFPIAGKEPEASVGPVGPVGPVGLRPVGKVEQDVGHRDVLDHLAVVVLGNITVIVTEKLS